MVTVQYDAIRDVTIIEVSGNVEFSFDGPQQPAIKDVTPDGLPLIVLAN